jgi:hypothetical protein
VLIVSGRQEEAASSTQLRRRRAHPRNHCHVVLQLAFRLAPATAPRGQVRGGELREGGPASGAARAGTGQTAPYGPANCILSSCT